MTLWDYIALGVMAGYSLYLLIMLLAVLLSGKPRGAHNSPEFSVVVPFRNEVDTLPDLLHSLEKLNYSKDLFEVILVDDHSSDGSERLDVSQYEVSVKLVKSRGQGKKHALMTGIASASYDLIAQTDADCEVPIEWLNHHASQLVEIHLSGGPVAFKDAPLQNLELFSYLGLACGSSALKSPILANAANMAYRKKDFIECGGFGDNLQISSGDDVFLLKSFASAGKHIGVSLFNDHLVYTKADTSIRAIFDQRIRWAGKTGRLGNAHTLISALLVVGANLFVVLQIIDLCIQGTLTEVGLIGVAVKFTIDFLFLFLVALRLKMLTPMVFYPIVAPLYSFYIVVLAPLSLFYKPTWKNRKIQT